MTTEFACKSTPSLQRSLDKYNLPTNERQPTVLTTSTIHSVSMMTTGMDGWRNERDRRASANADAPGRSGETGTACRSRILLPSKPTFLDQPTRLELDSRLSLSHCAFKHWHILVIEYRKSIKCLFIFFSLPNCHVPEF